MSETPSYEQLFEYPTYIDYYETNNSGEFNKITLSASVSEGTRSCDRYQGAFVGDDYNLSLAGTTGSNYQLRLRFYELQENYSDPVLLGEYDINKTYTKNIVVEIDAENTWDYPDYEFLGLMCINADQVGDYSNSNFNYYETNRICKLSKVSNDDNLYQGTISAEMMNMFVSAKLGSNNSVYELNLVLYTHTLDDTGSGGDSNLPDLTYCDIALCALEPHPFNENVLYASTFSNYISTEDLETVTGEEISLNNPGGHGYLEDCPPSIWHGAIGEGSNITNNIVSLIANNSTNKFLGIAILKDTISSDDLPYIVVDIADSTDETLLNNYNVFYNLERLETSENYDLYELKYLLGEQEIGTNIASSYWTVVICDLRELFSS